MPRFWLFNLNVQCVVLDLAKQGCIILYNLIPLLSLHVRDQLIEHVCLLILVAGVWKYRCLNPEAGCVVPGCVGDCVWLVWEFFCTRRLCLVDR